MIRFKVRLIRSGIALAALASLAMVAGGARWSMCSVGL